MNYKKICSMLLFVLILFSCKQTKLEKYSEEYFAMGTSLTIDLFSADKELALKVIKECKNIADNLEEKVSSTIDDSIISKLNRVKNIKIEDDFVYELLLESIEFAVNTDGAFDPALNNLTQLWGFENGNNTVPDKELIDKARMASGYRNIIIDSQMVNIKNNASINLGGIAKGKIIDELGKYLKSNGISDYLINGGGDITISGKHSGKRLWKIAIANPFDSNKFTGILEITDKSIVTSGDYERYFRDESGKMYHHILDPETGYPSDTGLHSVTLIADLPSKADAYATALFVMGRRRALEYVSQHDDLDIILISGSEESPEIEVSDKIKFYKDDRFGYRFDYKR